MPRAGRRPRGSTPSALDVDPGLEARRVQLAGRGREEEVHARLGRAPGRAVRRADSARDRRLAELGRVDEEAHDDRRALGPRRVEQGAVAGVQGAHRRHEPERRGRGARRAGAHALIVRTVVTTRPLGRGTSARARACAASAARCMACRPVATRDRSVRSKPFSMVRRISGTSASGGAPARSKSGRPPDRASRDSRRDGGAGMIEGTGIVSSSNARRPNVSAGEKPRARGFVDSAVTAPHAPSTVRPAPRVNVCSGWTPNGARAARAPKAASPR